MIPNTVTRKVLADLDALAQRLDALEVRINTRIREVERENGRLRADIEDAVKALKEIGV